MVHECSQETKIALIEKALDLVAQKEDINMLKREQERVAQKEDVILIKESQDRIERQMEKIWNTLDGPVGLVTQAQLNKQSISRIWVTIVFIWGAVTGIATAIFYIVKDGLGR